MSAVTEPTEMTPAETAELLADLAAFELPDGAGRDVGWLARPAILRRVARAVAQGIPEDVDSLICYGEQALALGVAVGLHTGLPVAHGSGGALRAGSVRAQEHVGVVAITAADAELGSSWAGSLDARVAASVAVFGPPDVASDVRVVIAVADGGRLQPQARLGMLKPGALAEPGKVESAARFLAAELLATLAARPVLVVSQDGGDGQVLAHAVARELGLARAVLHLDLGVMELVPEPAVTGPVVLVAPTLDGALAQHLPATLTMLAAKGLELAGVAVLSVDGASAPVPVTALVLTGHVT